MYNEKWKNKSESSLKRTSTLICSWNFLQRYRAITNFDELTSLKVSRMLELIISAKNALKVSDDTWYISFFIRISWEVQTSCSKKLV